jgi:hypothetical protein
MSGAPCTYSVTRWFPSPVAGGTRSSVLQLRKLDGTRRAWVMKMTGGPVFVRLFYPKSWRGLKDVFQVQRLDRTLVRNNLRTNGLRVSL